MTPTIRSSRAAMLAQADPEALADVADECLATAPSPEIHHGPDVGTVVLTVREPVETTRFHLGEVLVTRCQLEHRGVTAWAMRMGDDRAATLAAAICDAEVEADGPAAAAVRASSPPPTPNSMPSGPRSGPNSNPRLSPSRRWTDGYTDPHRRPEPARLRRDPALALRARNDPPTPTSAGH